MSSVIPVPAFREQLLRTGVAAEAELVEIERIIVDDITEAVEFALSSPFPEPIELARDVSQKELSL